MNVRTELCKAFPVPRHWITDALSTSWSKQMSKEKALPTIEQINDWLDYNRETGVFTWKKSRGKRFTAGDVAGKLSHQGYLQSTVPGCERASNHRLAYFIVYGVWPSGDVDHINGNGLDNRICNLRMATRSQNNQNRYKKSANKSTDMIGVSKRSDYDAYDARICVNGKQKCLGTFKTALEARKAYVAAKEKLHEYLPT
jgi:hypothetical protein